MSKVKSYTAKEIKGLYLQWKEDQTPFPLSEVLLFLEWLEQYQKGIDEVEEYYKKHP